MLRVYLCHGLSTYVLLPLVSCPPRPSPTHRWCNCGPGVDVISKMLKMQVLEDEDDLAYAETEKKARVDSTSDGRPAWMRTLHTTASNWLHLIPQTLSHLKRTVDNIKVAGAAPDGLSKTDGRARCAEARLGVTLLRLIRNAPQGVLPRASSVPPGSGEWVGLLPTSFLCGLLPDRAQVQLWGPGRGHDS